MAATEKWTFFKIFISALLFFVVDVVVLLVVVAPLLI